jgi:hypothetical protein
VARCDDQRFCRTQALEKFKSYLPSQICQAHWLHFLSNNRKTIHCRDETMPSNADRLKSSRASSSRDSRQAVRATNEAVFP